VRERGEIATRAERALRRNHREHVGREHGGEVPNQLRPHTGDAFREEVDLEEEDPADLVVVEVGAGARRVAQHDVALQIVQRGLLHGHARQVTDPGVDAVDGASFVDAALQERSRGLDPLHRIVRDAERRAVARDAHDVREREVVTVDVDHRIPAGEGLRDSHGAHPSSTRRDGPHGGLGHPGLALPEW
jgi:hypothetical protein